MDTKVASPAFTLDPDKLFKIPFKDLEKFVYEAGMTVNEVAILIHPKDANYLFTFLNPSQIVFKYRGVTFVIQRDIPIGRLYATNVLETEALSGTSLKHI